MPAAAPHDPAHHARLSYMWRDEHWHLLDTPEPAVVLVSSTVSQGSPYPDPAQAEAAFWRSVASSILTHHRRIVSATWPKVNAEAAVLLDPATNLFHLACRDGQAAGARCFTSQAEAHTAWADAVQALIADRFLGWTMWTSDTGRWWATRRTELTQDEADMGVARTLNADDPESLVELLLKEQAERLA
ncbi:hypothetical protein OG884_20160 [Streptosporangium sp. NBC_01755]|uniref:hypothetical protein n=1 Tax=unclassified Streptosporangium TaxID=2632669 RepID=UPI002DDA77DF|nr:MULTISPECIES: hypothetical protein [unclassified Streptosporangium]WSA24705.1 hypothetical protein OIE13_27750 [Streptosporangium sp. NBC_01810]WSC97218.1 hypothetical protein OG884_20160 [Streptosporangium sp. NBC_01755]